MNRWGLAARKLWETVLSLVSTGRPINLFADFHLQGFPPARDNVEALSGPLFDLVEARGSGTSDRCKVDDLRMTTIDLEGAFVTVGLWVAATENWELQINVQYPGARNQRPAVLAEIDELSREIEAHIRSRPDLSTFSWSGEAR